ncbi:MAG: hypothetical protein U5J63_02195 [Fodinibius sp.]|nr:hypothetical protein [Fodinibius sp.]
MRARSHYITTAGVGESTLSDKVIGDLSHLLSEDVSVAYLPSPQGTRIRISAYGHSQDQIEQRMEPVAACVERKPVR